MGRQKKGLRGAKPRDFRFGWAVFLPLDLLYNPEGQQRGGLLRGLHRLRSELRPDRALGDDPTAELVGRPFNTNPILSGWAIGPLLEILQEDRPDDSRVERIARIRGNLAPVVASIGDRLIGGAILPVLGLLGLLGAIFWHESAWVWYAVGCLGLPLYWRHRAWITGMAGERAVLEEIRSRSAERWISSVLRVGRIALGVFLGLAVARVWREAGPVAVLLFAGAVGIGFLLSRRLSISPTRLGWIALLLAALFGWISKFAMGGHL